LQYDIHYECEELVKKGAEFAVLPIANQMVRYGYLFPVEYPESNTEYLFTKYMGIRFQELLESDDWSILILLDDIPDLSDLNLIVSLGDGLVIMIAMFDEQILSFANSKKAR
jgi:hypothetical protein